MRKDKKTDDRTHNIRQTKISLILWKWLQNLSQELLHSKLSQKKKINDPLISLSQQDKLSQSIPTERIFFTL